MSELRSLLTKDGILVDYDNPSSLIVSFEKSTFSINRGLNVTKNFSTNFGETLTVKDDGHFLKSA